MIGEPASPAVSQISYRPGRRITAVYTVTAAGGDRRTVVLTAGEIPTGVTILESGPLRLGAWLFPHDPALPGLPLIFDEAARSTLLAPLGVDAAGASVATRSYRPGRRAVVEMRAGDTRLFVKAIPPSAAAALQRTHEEVARALPVPRSLGWNGDAGLVVLQALDGRPLSTAPDEGPDPAAILDLVDRIPHLDRAVQPRMRRVVAHARLARAIMPERAAAIDAIEEESRHIVDGPPRPVHGDLHSGQVLVRQGRLTGLIDVDTVGLGQPADDAANLIAHLHAVALGDKTGAAGRYGGRVFEAAVRRFDEPDLRRRVAATMLGYAVGPWSRQEAGWPSMVHGRIDGALDWIRPIRPQPDQARTRSIDGS